MYEKPQLTRIGTLREMTRAGCTSPSDGETFKGGTLPVSPGPIVTNGTTDYCFTTGSR